MIIIIAVLINKKITNNLDIYQSFLIPAKVYAQNKEFYKKYGGYLINDFYFKEIKKLDLGLLTYFKLKNININFKYDAEIQRYYLTINNKNIHDAIIESIITIEESKYMYNVINKIYEHEEIERSSMHYICFDNAENFIKFRGEYK